MRETRPRNNLKLRRVAGNIIQKRFLRNGAEKTRIMAPKPIFAVSTVQTKFGNLLKARCNPDKNRSCLSGHRRVFSIRVRLLMSGVLRLLCHFPAPCTYHHERLNGQRRLSGPGQSRGYIANSFTCSQHFPMTPTFLMPILSPC